MGSTQSTWAWYCASPQKLLARSRLYFTSKWTMILVPSPSQSRAVATRHWPALTTPQTTWEIHTLALRRTLTTQRRGTLGWTQTRRPWRNSRVKLTWHLQMFAKRDLRSLEITKEALSMESKLKKLETTSKMGFINQWKQVARRMSRASTTCSSAMSLEGKMPMEAMEDPCAKIHMALKSLRCWRNCSRKQKQTAPCATTISAIQTQS